MKTNYPVCLLLWAGTFTFFVGCKKFVLTKGETITVSGSATANNVNGPIPNATILIEEFTSGLFHSNFSKVIDSVLTDSLGNYAVSFETTGNGNQYKVAIRVPDNYISYLTDAVLLDPAKANKVNFQGDKLSKLRAHFKIINNTHPPLFVDAEYAFNFYEYKINDTADSTTVYMNALPNQQNIYLYYINVSDSPNVKRWSADTIYLDGMADTFEHSFLVDPSTFK